MVDTAVVMVIFTEVAIMAMVLMEIITRMDIFL